MSTTETTLFDFTDEPVEWDGVFRVVQCRRALSPSGLDEMDYALNPYTGCEHGCIYCYGPAVTHTDQSKWRVVRVKANIADRLLKELPAVEGVIGIGTVTDPYQAAEGRFRLTKRCLEILSEKERAVHIHTKSDLILRDLDILSGMDATVGVTITGLDDRISKLTEPGAPLPERRLDALTKLTDAGIKTYALVAPVMSSLEGHERELLERVRETGTGRVCISELHYHNVDMSRLEKLRITNSPNTEARLMDIGHELGFNIADAFR